MGRRRLSRRRPVHRSLDPPHEQPPTSNESLIIMPAPSTESELATTRNTRLRDEPRVPQLNDEVFYREWDIDTRQIVRRRAVITQITDAESPDSTVVLTYFTPASLTGTAVASLVRRGQIADHWDYT